MFPQEQGLSKGVVYTEDAIPADCFRPPAPAGMPLNAAPAPALPAGEGLTSIRARVDPAALTLDGSVARHDRTSTRVPSAPIDAFSTFLL
jgi:hypothetical protein